MNARQVQGLQDRFDRSRISAGELFGEGADFFGMILPQLLGGHRGETDAVGNGASVPGLAHAEAVHLVDFHVRDHLRGRNGDERDVTVWVNAARREPVAGPHRVGAGREGHRERHRGPCSLRLVHQRLDGGGGARPRLLQLVVERDRLAVAVEQPGNHHRLHRRSRQPHRRRERHAEEHVGRVILAERELVPDHRPRRFFRDDRGDAEFLEEAELVRHDDRRAIGERDDAKTDGGRFGRVVGIEAARPAGRKTAHQHPGGGAGRLQKCASGPHHVFITFPRERRTSP